MLDLSETLVELYFISIRGYFIQFLCFFLLIFTVLLFGFKCLTTSTNSTNITKVTNIRKRREGRNVLFFCKKSVVEEITTLEKKIHWTKRSTLDNETFLDMSSIKTLQGKIGFSL